MEKNKYFEPIIKKDGKTLYFVKTNIYDAMSRDALLRRERQAIYMDENGNYEIIRKEMLPSIESTFYEVDKSKETALHNLYFELHKCLSLEDIDKMLTAVQNLVYRMTALRVSCVDYSHSNIFRDYIDESHATFVKCCKSVNSGLLEKNLTALVECLEKYKNILCRADKIKSDTVIPSPKMNMSSKQASFFDKKIIEIIPHHRDFQSIYLLSNYAKLKLKRLDEEKNEKQ